MKSSWMLVAGLLFGGMGVFASLFGMILWGEALPLTQAEVAIWMGITQAALSQMESGEKRLRKASLEKLAMAMDISVEQLR